MVLYVNVLMSKRGASNEVEEQHFEFKSLSTWSNN